VNFAVKCAACVIACFERIIRFLTENAYIMMAITGNNFCASARESFYLIMRCAGQFALSRNTTKLFMTLGKIFIVAWCCVIGYIFITSMEPYKSEIYEPIFLTLVFGLASYPIAAAFMTLFEMAANTLLVCYCI
jgi:choline transporter-like protein 2/4/5